MLRAHPSLVRLSPDGHDEDDHSELTGTSSTDDHWQDDDLQGNIGTDPVYYHDFGGILPSSPEKREILELKVQLARQQEELESLSLKLRQCEDDNEALDPRRQSSCTSSRSPSRNRPRQIERSGRRSSPNSRNAGPVRQLVDFNTAPTMENARLQAVVNVTQKSFKAHVRESRRLGDKDKKTIGALRWRQEDKLLQLHRALCESKDLRRSSSERAARTSLRSSFTKSVVDDSLGSGPVPDVNFCTSGDGWIAGGEEAEDAYVRKRAPRTRRTTVDCASSEDTKRSLATGPRAPRPTTAKGCSNIIW